MGYIALQEQDWMVTTDTVMGGVSTLSVLSEPKGIRLRGVLSHENNGGFVSARMSDGIISCPTEALGIRVLWEGDTRLYRFILHEKGRRVREYFECTLSHRSETLLWTDFTYRHRKMSDTDRQFSPDQLNSIGILLSNTHTGSVDFYLQKLEWVLS